jgi:uncharacterized protein YjbI with pentapeptide repeats
LVNCKFIDCDSEEDILKSGLCIFHDKDYLQVKDSREQNEENVRTKLMVKLREKVDKKEPLFCIGYYLPSIRLVNEIFTNPVNFSKCKFQGEADFSHTTFSRQADFRQAEFSERTFFNSAKFSGEEVYFSKAKFSGERTYFNRTTFSGKRTYINRTKFSGEETYFNEANFSGGRTYLNSAEFSGGRTYLNSAEFSGERTSFDAAKFSAERTSFYKAEFSGGRTSFFEAKFSGQADFTDSDFKEEVTFEETIFPRPEADIALEETSAKSPQNSHFIKLSSEDAKKIVIVDNKGSYTHIKDFQSLPPEEDKTIPIKFDYCKFRKTVQFKGKSEKKEPLRLGLVSFKGVDLSQVEFHNVEWQKIKEMIFITRNVIVDEKMLDKENGNYEEVSKIYNQLRKNYESKLLFNEASNFFIGEMEAIRKKLLNGTARQKLSSIPYSLYKGLALYGESYFLPLIVWTPAIIIGFFALRFYLGECSVQPVHVPILPIHAVSCSTLDKIIDSFAAYFQFPRSSTNPYDTVERIVSIPILGTAFIAIRRKFERIK